MLERFKPIEHSLDIYSLTYAVSQLTRTSGRKEQNSTNISKTTCQKLANEKRSLNSINYHNSNNKTYCFLDVPRRWILKSLVLSRNAACTGRLPISERRLDFAVGHEYNSIDSLYQSACSNNQQQNERRLKGGLKILLL